MENFENFERIPLINRESPASRIIEKYKKCCCICIFIIPIIIIITIFGMIETPEEYPNDITIIPYEYQLRLDGLFFKPNYVIESLPTELKSNIKNEKDNDYKQNSFPNEYTRLADIIPDRWSFEILTKFTVQEYRYYPNYTFYKVSTVNVKMHSFFSSAIDITFNAADNIDPELIEACEYRITWTWFMNGYIWRKCKNSNEQEFIKVSYFKGSTGWGLEFYDSDGNIKYGYTSKTDFWWNQYKRDVVVYPSAPFPPIMPALYSACYDYVRENNRDRNHRNRRIENK